MNYKLQFIDVHTALSLGVTQQIGRDHICFIHSNIATSDHLIWFNLLLKMLDTRRGAILLSVLVFTATVLHTDIVAHTFSSLEGKSENSDEILKLEPRHESTKSCWQRLYEDNLRNEGPFELARTTMCAFSPKNPEQEKHLEKKKFTILLIGVHLGPPTGIFIFCTNYNNNIHVPFKSLTS